jgi:hypothetical protein
MLFCHESRNAARALDLLCREADAEEPVRHAVEASYGRIRDLKRLRLASSKGVTEENLGGLIASHREIVAEIQGKR